MTFEQLYKRELKNTIILCLVVVEVVYFENELTILDCVQPLLCFLVNRLSHPGILLLYDSSREVCTFPKSKSRSGIQPLRHNTQLVVPNKLESEGFVRYMPLLF